MLSATIRENEITALSFFDVLRSESGDFIHSGISGKLAKEVVTYFDGIGTAFTTKLLLKGTNFQLKVWEEIRKIPFGETRTYSEIAVAVGRPSAVRAVGAAVGQNKHLLLIPCHRVVGSDGRLTGYSGGLDRKRWLLDHERRHSSPASAVKTLFDEI